jgi:uncharacterized damage-inducible protein DinB
MKDQILEAWHINNRVNLKLLGAISDEGMNCTLSKRGGRTVALQFAHLHNVRLGWLEASAKDLFKGQTKINKDHVVDRALLQKRLAESAEAVARLLERGIENGGQVRGFKRGVVPLLGYFMTHDAHHRGSILLTLKQSGHKVSTEIQYGIWDWQRI